MDIIKDIAETFVTDKGTITSYIFTAPYKYKVYTIPKRSGDGRRTIAQPTKELKIFQRLVLENYFNSLPVHDAATAYTKGRDIKFNANLHRRNRFLLKMDFTDFFSSIVHNDFINHIEAHMGRLDQDNKLAVKKIFFRSTKNTDRHWLSIGAPSSPFISNTVLFEFDTRVHDYAAQHNITYSRYADDLTLTTNDKNLLFDTPNVIKQICAQIAYPTLKVNDNKTVFSSKKFNRHVTGIVINNQGEISLGRSRKRYIKSLVYRHLNGQLDEEEIGHLRGLLSFASHIEPNFIIRLKTKYGIEIIETIKQS